MRSAAALLLALACACSAGVRATDPAVAPGEATTVGAASPEPGGAPLPASPPGSDLPADAATLQTLASCWFEAPYDYMFGGGPTVTIGQGSYGMLMAGVRGFLYYSDLNTCAGRVTARAPTSYSDAGPFGALAGLPVFAEQAGDDRPFGFYNPAIVEWGRQNLLPDPQTTVGGVPFQVVYARVFSRFFRMMTEAYLHLASSGAYRQDMDAYWAMATAGAEDGLGWLEGRYAQALPSYPESQDGTTMTASMAIGFWLRRGIDGTSDELWLGLRDLMRRFDGQWYGGLRATYGSPDIEW